MKIQPAATQPTFQMRWTQRLIQQKKLTQITLDNGSKLLVRESPDYKLQSLYDKAGNWVKSKLKFYKGNKVYKVIRSENNV